MKSNLLRYIILSLSALILASCQKDVFTGPVETQQTSFSKIFIRTNPSGARIYYQGRYMGLNTPDTLTWLPTGYQRIVLKKELFLDEIIDITLADKKTAEVFIDYANDPKQVGSLLCKSFVDAASIYINGKDTGYKTNYTFEKYFPGYYSVKYVKNGFRSDSVSVAVTAGIPSIANFVLQDTTRWVDYKTSNSKLASDDCYSIICDKKNIKWIATGRGVSSFDGKNWRNYDNTTSVLQGPITQLMVDKQSRIWASSRNGLFMFNGATWIDWTSNLSSHVVTGITCDLKGVIWIATVAGLVKYDGLSWQTYNASNSGIVDNVLSCVAASSDGKIWFSNTLGLGYFDGQKFISIPLTSMGIDVTIGSNIVSICPDAQGNIWVAHVKGKSERGGLTKFDGATWKEITFAIMPTDDLNAINVDSNNNKWISRINGLGKFAQLSDIKVFSKLDTAIPVRNVMCSTVDNNGDAWFVTLGDGLVKIKKGNY